MSYSLGVEYAACAARKGVCRDTRVADPLILYLDVAEDTGRTIRVAGAVIDRLKSHGRIDRDRCVICVNRISQGRLLDIEDILALLPSDVRTADAIDAFLVRSTYDDLCLEQLELGEHSRRTRTILALTEAEFTEA